MTDPLLWLHGDTTEGRRVRVPEPEDPAAAPASPADPAPAPPGRRGARSPAAVAGGLVSATLVAGGAAALGVLDAGDQPAARPGPAAAAVGARQQGDVAAIYAAASPSVVSVRT